MIQMTETAVSKVNEILGQQSPKPKGLRLSVVGGGCSGFQYSMAFENNQLPLDKVYNYDGLQIFVDQASLLYLDNCRVDYVETMEGAGFKFDKPQRDLDLRLRQFLQRIARAVPRAGRCERDRLRAPGIRTPPGGAPMPETATCLHGRAGTPSTGGKTLQSCAGAGPVPGRFPEASPRRRRTPRRRYRMRRGAPRSPHGSLGAADHGNRLLGRGAPAVQAAGPAQGSRAGDADHGPGGPPTSIWAPAGSTSWQCSTSCTARWFRAQAEREARGHRRLQDIHS